MKLNKGVLLTAATILVLLAMPQVQAGQPNKGGTSSTGGGSASGGTNGTAGNGAYATQTGNITSTNGFLLDVNGSPANTDGHDHIYVPNVGMKLNTIPALPTGTNISYTTVTNTSVTPSTTVKIQQATVDGVTKETGKRYEQVTEGGVTKYVAVVPGAGVSKLTKGELNGTSDTTPTGIIASGLHSSQQVAGGITNEYAKKYESIEALIDAVKKGADTYVDISKSVNVTGMDEARFGNPDTQNYKIVYAKGSKNSDGSINAEPDSTGTGGLKFAGGFKGAGILVVEIDNPDTAQLEFSGSSMWVGLVVVVANKNPSKNNAAPLVTVGGGNEIHIIGGSFVYMRNLEGNLIGQNFAKLAGQADVKYSSQALNYLNQATPASMEVRSWTKLDEE